MWYNRIRSLFLKHDILCFVQLNHMEFIDNPFVGMSNGTCLKPKAVGSMRNQDVENADLAINRVGDDVDPLDGNS